MTHVRLTLEEQEVLQFLSARSGADLGDLLEDTEMPYRSIRQALSQLNAKSYLRAYYPESNQRKASYTLSLKGVVKAQEMKEQISSLDYQAKNFDVPGYSFEQVSAWLDDVAVLGEKNVKEGGGPFSAAIYKDGSLLCTGVNRVTQNNDPTAHAEVQAIRSAGQLLNDFSLKGCLLISSCEPCPMCLTASFWARVDGIVYGADRHDAGNIGFDDSEFYDIFASPRSSWSIPVRQVIVPAYLLPFQAWSTSEEKTEY